MADKLSEQEKQAIQQASDRVQRLPSVRFDPPAPKIDFDKIPRRKITRAGTPPKGPRPRHEEKMTVRRALEWAFVNECARLEFDEDEFDIAGPGFGVEYRLLQQGALNAQIDTSPGRSLPHHDAEMIAALVSTIPQEIGGRGLAIFIAQSARTGLVPDWMPEAVAKCQPREWRRRTSAGVLLGRTEILRDYKVRKKYPHPRDKRKRITKEVRVLEEWTPVTFDPHPQEIETARMEYNRWWSGIAYLWLELTRNPPETITILDTLPPRCPWASSSA
jgi:hypothetical protein